jgi:hypothetical protein
MADDSCHECEIKIQLFTNEDSQVRDDVENLFHQKDFHLGDGNMLFRENS